MRSCWLNVGQVCNLPIPILVVQRRASDSAKIQIRVRVPAGMLTAGLMSSGCEGEHASLRSSRTRFDSWRGRFGGMRDEG